MLVCFACDKEVDADIFLLYRSQYSGIKVDHSCSSAHFPDIGWKAVRSGTRLP